MPLTKQRQLELNIDALYLVVDALNDVIDRQGDVRVGNFDLEREERAFLMRRLVYARNNHERTLKRYQLDLERQEAS